MGVKPALSQYGKKWAVGVRQRGDEGGILTSEGASDRGLEGTERLHCEKRAGLYY